MRKFQVITLFPQMFEPVFGSSMMWKAQKENIVKLTTIDLRDFGLGPRKQVDDTPYGGGDGMLLMPEPLFNAVAYAKKNDPSAKVVLMTPRGKRWEQSAAQNWSEAKHGYIFICGHYEGFDERIYTLADSLVSIGDFILTGGEIPAMAITDSVVRLIDGVITSTSLETESFNDNLLDYPNYTKPVEYRGMKVPDVLLSGHHENINKYRHEKQIELTKKNRPDLLGGEDA